MGLPIDHFVAITNVNDTVPRYLEQELIILNLPFNHIQCYGCGNPSNFVEFKNTNNDLVKMKKYSQVFGSRSRY